MNSPMGKRTQNDESQSKSIVHNMKENIFSDAQLLSILFQYKSLKIQVFSFFKVFQSVLKTRDVVDIYCKRADAMKRIY